MKFASCSRRLVGTAHKAAFTLIELLTVMTIILVLAGLVLSIAGSAQYNSAKQRATSEIKGLETAIESYKVDNGAYPQNTDTDKLNPQSITFVEPTQDVYKKSSEYLYQELTGTRPNATSPGKGYIFPKASQLGVASDGTGTATPTSPYMYFADPFGFSYGYSTAYLKAANANAANPTATPPNLDGYNPTFDLWSTAGYSSSGKATPRNMGVTGAAAYSKIWVTNW